MEYSLKEIKFEKKEFEKYIIVLKNFVTWGSHECCKNHLRILHVITSIIKKYHNYDNWFLKKFLTYCLREKDFIYIIYNNNKDVDEIYFKTEFSNIMHILRKCYTSEILEFIVKKVSVPPIKSNNKDDWYNKNIFFNYHFFDFIYDFILKIPNDIKIPNTFNSCNTVTEQLLFAIVIKYRFMIPIYLRKDNYFYD